VACELPYCPTLYLHQLDQQVVIHWQDALAAIRMTAEMNQYAPYCRNLKNRKRKHIPSAVQRKKDSHRQGQSAQRCTSQHQLARRH
jgi:hypothetical protein